LTKENQLKINKIASQNHKNVGFGTQSKESVYTA